MAEMNTMERSSKGQRRAQKRSTQVDLTAMVDLGFLLITFFMLASAFSKPKAMEVNKPVPEDNGREAPIQESRTLTILAGKNDKLYCYTAADDALHVNVDTINFSRNVLRSKILERKQEVIKMWGNDQDFVVLLKLFPRSKFRNMVDLLDEMKICGVKRYAIVDELNETDQQIALRSGND